jgi:hypothetical protein
MPRPVKEQLIEEVLLHNPHLIDPEFEGAGRSLERQTWLGVKNRLDLLGQLAEGACIIELKRGPLTPNDAGQILRYCRDWPAIHPDRRLAGHHYLIGRRPRQESALLEVTRAGGVEIRIRYIGVHIPDRIVWDEETRRYVPWTRDRRLAETITLRFR